MKNGFEVRLPLFSGGYVAGEVYSLKSLAESAAEGLNAILFTSPMPGLIPSIMDMPQNADAPHERMRYVEKIRVPDDFMFADYENA